MLLGGRADKMQRQAFVISTGIPARRGCGVCGLEIIAGRAFRKRYNELQVLLR